MTGYDIYCICRQIMKRSVPILDTYLESSEKPYYELLRDYLIKNKQLNIKDIKKFLNANYCNNPALFNPYKLIEQESWDVYIDWCKYKSTKSLYFNEIKNSFSFIENFCINKNIDFRTYKANFSRKHIREKKIDYAVAIHLQLVDMKKLQKVDKLLLKNFISQYNIVESRLSNQELKQLLISLTDGMTKLLQEYQKDI